MLSSCDLVVEKLLENEKVNAVDQITSLTYTVNLGEMLMELILFRRGIYHTCGASRLWRYEQAVKDREYLERRNFFDMRHKMWKYEVGG